MLHIAKKTKHSHKKAIAGEIIISLALLVVFAIPAAQAGEITADSIIRLVNEARKSTGVAELKKNELLTKAAQEKAEDMIENDYFAHVSPSGISPWEWIERSGYAYKYAGENLAINFTDAQEQQKAWMDSPLHRKNILNPSYEEIGVAAVKGVIDGHKTIVAVQMFGTSSSEVEGAMIADKYPAEREAAPVDMLSGLSLETGTMASSFSSGVEKINDWRNHYNALIAWSAVLIAALTIAIVDSLTLWHRKHGKPVIGVHIIRNHQI